MVSNSIAHCILWRCVAITGIKQVIPPCMLPHEGCFDNFPFPMLIIPNQDLFTPCKLHMCTPLEQLTIKTAHLAQKLLIRTAVTWKCREFVAGHMKFYSVFQTGNLFASLHETLKASAKVCPNADCNTITTLNATSSHAQDSATEPTSLLFNMEFWWLLMQEQCDPSVGD